MGSATQTLVVWRRLGKEHGEGSGFRKNSPDTIGKHIEDKVERFRRVPNEDWRWWQIDEELIIEKPLPETGLSDHSVIYYLTKLNCAVIEDFSPRKPDRWFWYVHIASFDYAARLETWIMTDLFADIVVGKAGQDHAVLDLDELAHAARIGLIQADQLYAALESCQAILDGIRNGQFPPKDIGKGRGFLKARNWR